MTRERIAELRSIARKNHIRPNDDGMYEIIFDGEIMRLRGDQIDPYAKTVIRCKPTTELIAEELAHRLLEFPEKTDRRKAILGMTKYLCLECGNEKLPCFCIADQ